MGFLPENKELIRSFDGIEKREGRPLLAIARRVLVGERSGLKCTLVNVQERE